MLSNVVRHRIPASDPGVELALIEWPGDGPPALFHHANGFGAALWAPVVEHLGARFRVFALDARGHGRSSKPEGDASYAWKTLALDIGVAADWVIDQCGSDALELGVGHSFGGTLTMAAAAARAGRYRRALLVDPVILPPGVSDSLPAGESPMVMRARRRRHHWDSREAAREFFAEKPLFADWTGRALDVYVAEGLVDSDDGVELACPGRAEAAIFAGAAAFDPYAIAEKADLPVRLLRATRGDFPREAYRAIVDRLPDGELGEIEGGHLVVMERPEAVADAILAYAG